MCVCPPNFYEMGILLECEGVEGEFSSLIIFITANALIEVVLHVVLGPTLCPERAASIDLMVFGHHFLGDTPLRPMIPPPQRASQSPLLACTYN